MLAEHISTESSVADRGRAFGRAHAPAVGNTLAAYERLFGELHGLDPAAIRALGRRAGEGLGARQRDEIAAIADGAGVDADCLLAANARTEILAGSRPAECSAIGVLPERSSGPTILAQNWDWHPDLIESRVVWTIVEPDGRWLTTLTEAGILAKVGLNSHGVGVCLNILGSSADGGVGGAPIHVLCRRVLEEAHDVTQALALLRAATATASSCINVAHCDDEGSAMASFEVSPAGVGIVEPRDGVLLHTNHFLTPIANAEDTARRDWPDTVDRLHELDARVRRGPGVIDEDTVKTALRSHDAGRIAVCCHDLHNPVAADRQGTLASVFLNLDERRMQITDGPPCRAPYRPVAVASRLDTVR
jgi:isopenicillin-N N-acyltransferase like protein